MTDKLSEQKGLACRQAGFTILELITALSVFMVVMTISMGSILGVFDANRRARAESAIMNNLNLAVESMGREMRFGKNYHCGSTGDLTQPQNCPSGGDYVSFLSSDRVQISYRYNQSQNSIEKCYGNGCTFVAVTAPEVIIESLTFYVLGAGTGDVLQPRVLIKVRGYSGDKPNVQSRFTLQTTVSQRVLDKNL